MEHNKAVTELNKSMNVEAGEKGTVGKVKGKVESKKVEKTKGTYLEKVKVAMKKLNYEIYTKSYILNIVGIRSKTRNANLFDDKMVVFYTNESGKEVILSKKGVVEYYDITTDPGFSSLGYIEPEHRNEKDSKKAKYRDLMNKEGCAILKEGQYKETWEIAKHKGQYEALCQLNGKVTVYRDSNKDYKLNTDSKCAEGYFGINIHKPWKDCITKQTQVYNTSAGCQVFADPNEFNILMKAARLQVKKVKENYFTYTLLKEEEI